MRTILIENHSADRSSGNLANNLIQLMKENNVSESELARALDIPYNTIHRLTSGHTTDPRISTLKSIATYFNVSLDRLFDSSCQSNQANNSEKNAINEALLHYILKQSHHLYPLAQNGNNDYADFVLSLLKEITDIDTSKDNLLKIIDLATSSISSYEKTRKKHKQAI